MLAIFLALLSLSGLALSLKFSREVRSYLGAAANDTARPNLRSFAAEALQKKSYLGAILLLLSVCLIFKGFSFALWFLIGACAFLLGRALFCDDLEQAAQALCESVAKNEEFRTRRVIFINAAGAHLLFISAAGMLGALLYFYSSFPSLPALVSALSLGAALAAMYGITLFLPHSEGLSPVSTYQPFLFNLYLLSLAALVKVSSNLNLFLVAQRDWFILAGFVVLLFALAGVILAYRAYEEMQELAEVEAFRAASLLNVGVVVVLVLLYALFFEGVTVWHWFSIFVLALAAFSPLPISAQIMRRIDPALAVDFPRKIQMLQVTALSVFAFSLSVFFASRVDSAYSLAFLGLVLLMLAPSLGLFCGSSELVEKAQALALKRDASSAVGPILANLQNSFGLNIALSRAQTQALVTLSLLCAVAAQLWVGFDLAIEPLSSTGGKGVLCIFGVVCAYFCLALALFLAQHLAAGAQLQSGVSALSGVFALSLIALLPVGALLWANIWFRLGFLALALARAILQPPVGASSPQQSAGFCYSIYLIALTAALF